MSTNSHFNVARNDTLNITDPNASDQGGLQALAEWKKERELQKEIEELQNSLMNYDFQKCPRIKKESFRDLDVGDIDLVRIAFIGPTGSGITSLIGTLQRALGVNQGIYGRGFGQQDTYRVEEFYLQKQIRLVDTPGWLEADERVVFDILSGRIRSGEKPEYYAQKKERMTQRACELSKCAHAMVFVVIANDPRLKYGVYESKLRKIRERLRENGYSPVTVITNMDRVRDDEETEKTIIDMATSAIGSSSDKIYFIVNDTHDTFERKEWHSTRRIALDILDSALTSAERFIQVRKQREKNQLERELVAAAASSGVETVEQFFARLQKKYKWTNQGKMKDVLFDLHSKEIRTVNVLKELWEEVKLLLPLSIGMKKCIEEEITSLGIGNVFDFTASSSAPIVS